MKVPRARRRGKSKVFTVNDFRAIATSKMIKSADPLKGRITEIIKDVYRTAPLMKIKFENGETSFLPAFSGAYVGMNINYMDPSQPSSGSILQLKDIPTGTDIYNVELMPNDGGKLVRSGGSTAKLVENISGISSVSLPSGKLVKLNQQCRAIIGRIANSGRKEKPFYKAGNKFHMIKARGRYWPMTAAVAMNAYEHKFGGKRRSSQHKSKSVPRNAPAGAKVGTIAPRRTGIR